jgi:alpha-L-fucosidase
MRRISICSMLCLFLSVSSAFAQTAHETPEQFQARTKWWREAKFGMFIHWGIYAVPADSTDLEGHKSIAEWYFSNKQLHVRDYEKFASQFDPEQFDAHRWVETAKNAGMKYIVITSKHHDGFSMFGTKMTDYNVVDGTPWHHDPMKDLAAECQRQGLRLCFYHSIMDWHHPDYLPRRKWDERPVDGASLDHYIEYMKGELKELLTNYGPIGILWWDGGWEHSAAEIHSAEVNSFVRSLAPSIIINDRNKLPEDYSTPEQDIPASAVPGGRLWETCMTINDTWGYAKNDTNWKSAEDLTRKLIDIASKGGNFLLNVGPTAEGVFPQPIMERLARMGEWMKVNGASIYGTTQCPFRNLPFDGRCTVNGSKLYLQVFNWPSEGLKLTDLDTQVRRARALEGGEALKVSVAGAAKTNGKNGPRVVSISKPTKIDPIATVVELDLAGEPRVARTNLAVPAAKDGSYHLDAGLAEVHGKTIQYDWQGVEREDYIGSWTNPGDYVTWTLNLAAPKKFRVEISYACPAGNEGSAYAAGVEGGASLRGVAQATKGDRDFRKESLGELTVPAGLVRFEVQVTKLAHGEAMNLHTVSLVPVP